MKKTIFSLLIVGVILLSTGSTQAQGSSDRSQTFCTNQKTRQSEISSKFQERVDNYNEAVKTQTERKNDRREEWDNKLSKARENADEKRNKSYELLEEKQPSEENKELARQFAQEVSQAVSERRQAYDAARAKFRQTVDDFLSLRHQEVGGAIDTFQSSATEAMDSAAKRCGASNKSQARTEAVDKLKGARLAYGEKLRNRKKVGDVVREAIEVRQTEFKQATDLFQQKMQAIREKYNTL